MRGHGRRAGQERGLVAVNPDAIDADGFDRDIAAGGDGGGELGAFAHRVLLDEQYAWLPTSEVEAREELLLVALDIDHGQIDSWRGRLSKYFVHRAKWHR